MLKLVTWKSWNLLVFKKFWDLRFKNPKDFKSLFTLDSICGEPLVLFYTQ